jgi:hypothetical protein
VPVRDRLIEQPGQPEPDRLRGGSVAACDLQEGGPDLLRAQLPAPGGARSAGSGVAGSARNPRGPQQSPVPPARLRRKSSSESRARVIGRSAGAVFRGASRSGFPPARAISRFRAAARRACAGVSQRRDLMEIVDDRYGRKATVITSQLPVESWYDIIADPTFADAILDRLVHHAHRIALDGPSMRKNPQPAPTQSELKETV